MKNSRESCVGAARQVSHYLTSRVAWWSLYAVTPRVVCKSNTTLPSDHQNNCTSWFAFWLVAACDVDTVKLPRASHRKPCASTIRCTCVRQDEVTAHWAIRNRWTAMLLGLDRTCRLGGTWPTRSPPGPGCRLTRPPTPVPASACPLHLCTSPTFLVIVAK